ncbi:MAG: 2-oxoglutarate dehydrogenase E1 component [Micavibrio aeruginosavorus]|uniref:oxoglutarate dehydrogenase (succinyl-transferring) n=1 Tax=Micavibrio aeruginosavorus TaxID=349221 RepID=A0A2W5HNL6_9BACT|nr:MAG: 2-oxoglutarate dehydrogenase E1 component [Micavibrio aeruginosavorus]
MSTSPALVTILSSSNAEYIANLYKEFLHNPNAIDASWRTFFNDLKDDETALLKEITGASWASPHYKKPAAPFGVTTADEAIKGGKAPANQSKAPQASYDTRAMKDSIQAMMLVKAYRANGHLMADLDPLGLKRPQMRAELDPVTYGFSAGDMDHKIYVGGILGFETTTIRDLVSVLQQIYCGKIGIEYEHVISQEERNWLQQKIESTGNKTQFSADEKKAIYQNLVNAQGLEDFLALKYVGTKRFGVDGGESYVACVEEIIAKGAELGVEEVIIGMAHRGRLNTLTNIVGKPFTKLFAEFNGMPSTPDDTPGSGDVKYHMGYSTDRVIGGKTVHMSLTPNPSHLEVVNPVVVGKVRAKQDLEKGGDRKSVLPLTIHGDSAFAGQGLVAEILMMAELPGYTAGGTVHIIINNQIGFTTLPEYYKSGPYSSDMAKMLAIPTFHVNGDDPEAVAHVSRMAIEFRQKFGHDVIIDLMCYRKNGHNEGDEPMFTQPVMYKAIKEQVSTRNQYAAKLAAEGVMSADDSKAMVDAFHKKMEEAFAATSSYKVNKADWLEGAWSGLTTHVKSKFGEKRKGETSITEAQLKMLGERLVDIPSSFNLNSKIARQFDAKKEMFKSGTGFDWGTGESLAFASLVQEGYPVRVSGEDAGRGTFSHRHATLHDQDNASRYYPLQHIAPDQANFEVHDSPLSEAGVLGFELGYSWAAPNSLTIWEAQFGDFVNGAQVIIDQYIASAETKWLRMSGLVMLLPHGFEGQGPEHSSARLERFLQLCAEDNMQVTNITTPANYFHALRRQLKRDFRKPLINMSPKSLLRHKLAVSKAEDFTGQTSFHRFLWDDARDNLAKPKDVKRVVMCSGKVYYDLFEEREKRGIKNVVIYRLEQFYPFPEAELAEELAQYPNAEFVWCQEEPKNQGGWFFVEPLLEETLVRAKFKGGKRFKYAGRPSSASPATGYAKRHALEQARLVDEALKL